MDAVSQNEGDHILDSESKLGQEISHHPVMNLQLKRLGGVFLGAITILAALIIFLLYLRITYTMINHYGSAILLKQIPALLIVIGVGLLIGLPILITSLRRWKDGVTIHEHGIVVRKSAREHTWYWQDITRLDSEIKSISYAGGDVSEKYFVILENHQSKELVIENRYESMEKLVNQIRSFVMPRLYDHACRLFAEGKDISFHKDLRANAKGLIIKDQSKPFAEFDQPQITNRHLLLTLKSEKQNYHFRLSQISNLDLLRHLFTYPPNKSSPVLNLGVDQLKMGWQKE